MPSVDEHSHVPGKIKPLGLGGKILRGAGWLFELLFIAWVVWAGIVLANPPRTEGIGILVLGGLFVLSFFLIPIPVGLLIWEFWRARRFKLRMTLDVLAIAIAAAAFTWFGGLGAKVERDREVEAGREHAAHVLTVRTEADCYAGRSPAFIEGCTQYMREKQACLRGDASLACVPRP